MRYPASLDLSLAMLIAGSAVTAGKVLTASLPVFLATELGLSVGLLCLLPMTFILRRERILRDLRTNIVLLAQAACGIVLYRVCILYGLKLTSASLAGLISSAAPVVIAALAFAVLREKPNLKSVAGIASVTAGLVAVNMAALGESGNGLLSLKGNLLVFAAVCCEALFSIMSKAGSKSMSALYRTTAVAVYAWIILLPLSVQEYMAAEALTFDLPSLICILYYGIFVSFLSYLFWFRGAAKVKAGEAGLYIGLVPLSSLGLSALLLGERITALHLVGLGCIITGIIFSYFSRDISSSKVEAEKLPE